MKMGITSMLTFSLKSTTNDMIEMTEEDNSVFYHTLACMEYKHKSEAATLKVGT